MANLKDFATGTVLTAPTPATTGTSFTLQSGEGALMPAVPFYATAHPDYQLPTVNNAEKILVTARPGNADTFTFTRAQSPTTAKSIAVGWRISNAVYAEDLFQGSIVTGETPTGLINGTNTAYTIATAFTPGSLRVFLNGQRLFPGVSNDYTENASLTGFTMNHAPLTGDVLLVDYNIGSTVIMQGTNVFINQETPTGLVNGSNAAYTTAKGYISGTLQVFINGLLQAPGTHVTEVSPTAGTFTLDTAPVTGDIVRVSYLYAASAGGNAATVNGLSANSTAAANQLYPLKASTTDANGWTVISLGWCTKYVRKGNVTGAAIGAGAFSYVTTGINLPVGCSWVGDHFTGGIVVNDQALSAAFTYNGGDNVRFAVQNQYTGGAVTPTIYWTLEFTKYHL